MQGHLPEALEPHSADLLDVDPDGPRATEREGHDGARAAQGQVEAGVVDEEGPAVLAAAVGTGPVETQGLRGPVQQEADLRPRQQVELEVGPRRGRVDEPGPALSFVLVERACVGHSRCRRTLDARVAHPDVDDRVTHPSRAAGASGRAPSRPAPSRRANDRRSRAACSTSTGTKSRTGPVSSEWASRLRPRRPRHEARESAPAAVAGHWPGPSSRRRGPRLKDQGPRSLPQGFARTCLRPPAGRVAEEPGTTPPSHRDDVTGAHTGTCTP